MYVGVSLTNDEAYWLAGLLEGEGSFLHGPPSAPNTPRIRIEMTDRDVVERAAQLMEVQSIHRGHRHPERGWKPSYSIVLKGVRSVRLMLALRPLMGELRRRQIDSALRDYAPRHARLSTSVVCQEDGCGRPRHGRDLCRKHYQRLVKNSGGKAPRLTVGELGPRIACQFTDSATRSYLAGLLEGEGTFSSGTPSSPGWCKLTLEMCERDAVEHARALMNSSPLRELRNQEHPDWRPAYKTELGGRRAEALMRELRPLMGQRRQTQIDRALACRAALPYVRLVRAPAHCITDGCDGKPRGRGLCHKHYMRWLRHEGASAIRERRRDRRAALI